MCKRYIPSCMDKYPSKQTSHSFYILRENNPKNLPKVLRNRDAQKRGNSELALSLEELHECVSSGFDMDDTVGFKELVATINRFLSQLPISERRVFVLRYWHTYPIDTICERLGYSKSKVESMLHRTRSKLRKQLVKEGYFL